MFAKIIAFIKGLFSPTLEEASTEVHEPVEEKTLYMEADLKKLTKGKLVDLAKQQYNVKLNIANKKQELIQQVLDLQKQ